MCNDEQIEIFRRHLIFREIKANWAFVNVVGIGRCGDCLMTTSNLRVVSHRVCYVMMVLASHPDAIVSKERAMYT